MRSINKVKIRTDSSILVWVGEMIFNLNIVDYVFRKFKKDQILSQEDWNYLIEKTIDYIAYNYGLRQIAFSAKAESDLAGKTKRKINQWLSKNKLELSNENIDLIIERNIKIFRAKKFLNDESFVESFMKRHKNKSTNMLKAMLLSKGIDKEIIDDKLKLKEEDQALLVKQLVSKALKGKTNISWQERNKLISSLARKGFPIDLVIRQIDDLTQTK